MPSGGHANSGPAPDPKALRRERDSGDWITLPAEGRAGDLPGWPLTKATQRELKIWADLWTKPQAVMWERLGQVAEVALYVRRLSIAEGRKAPTNAVTLVRQIAETLGLTITGLARNKWKIGTVRAESDRAPVDFESSRNRLRVVADGTAGT